MSNTNIRIGRSARGRSYYIGSEIEIEFYAFEHVEMEEIYIPKQPSWTELNRGKKTKRQRRI